MTEIAAPLAEVDVVPVAFESVAVLVEALESVEVEEPLSVEVEELLFVEVPEESDEVEELPSVVVEEESLEPPLSDPLLLVPPLTLIVHFLISSKASFPSLSLIGFKVITHV